jgi:hypothetical protein
MSESNALVPRDSEFALLAGDELKQGLTSIRQFHNTVKTLLVPNLDYGVIPGTGNKPTLLKPGAEKLAKMHKLCDSYHELDKIEDWDKPLFHYKIKCSLTHIPTGKLISEGLGECNSMEFKYRYRWVYENELPAGSVKDEIAFKVFTSKGGTQYKKYRVGNDDVYSQVNTILKIAKKRALVDAVLSAVRLSAVFTQDIEDMAHYDVEQVPDVKPDVHTEDSVITNLNEEIGNLAKEVGLDGQGLSNVIYGTLKKRDTEGATVEELTKLIAQLKRLLTTKKK